MQYKSVIILGRTNVGKSTVFNRLVKTKAHITSDKPNTTVSNHTIYCKNSHVCYTDTAGDIYDFTKLNANYDVCIYVIRAGQWTSKEEEIITGLRTTNLPVLLAITRVDTKCPQGKYLSFWYKIAPLVEPYVIDYFFLSGRHGHNVDLLEKRLAICPLRDIVREEIDDDGKTDKHTYNITEIVREKIMRLFHHEIPYNIKPTVYIQYSGCYVRKIYITLQTSSVRHKKILIGSGGVKIRTLLNMINSEILAIFPNSTTEIKIH